MSGSLLKDRQPELFHAVPYKISVSTKQSSTQSSLKAGKELHMLSQVCITIWGIIARFAISGSVFFD
jgi:hypothetical protein